ncbi:MAG: hypothetical protein LBQ67_07920 [Treponema sp.]|jgi:hypothetical protein|nr:hypothetical protein [Treponema sp.]
MSGYWKGSLQANWGIALTPLGTAAVSGDSPLLFTQEADLTLSLWIRERWFVEAGFLDDYDLNTYRAGYQGLEGEVVQYAGLGNTGLDFPSFPYLDLGGDSPSSFGFYGRFGTPDLAFHTLIRYDAAAREERVFVGNRERTYGYTDLSRPLRGVSFVLPDDNLGASPEVYIQDEKGALTDNEGRKWRRAEASEYAAGARYGLLDLTLGSYTGGSQEPQGMIAVSYPGGYSVASGDYANPSTFLGEVRDHFGIDLSQYPQPGQRTAAPGTTANIPGTVNIAGVNALVVYEPGTFSPFERQSRYRSAANSSDSAALVRLSTGAAVLGYEVVPLEEASGPADPISGLPAETSRGIYALFRGSSSADRRAPKDRWPLVDGTGTGSESWPELYLPGKKSFTADLGLRFTNYGSAGAYYIGTDVVPGSVQVYRGGLLDPNFSFNPSGGTVTLGSPALFNETIRISYLKRSQERRLGSLAAGIGAIWDPEGVFSGKIALGLRWNLSSDAYSEEGASSPGAVGLGAEARWDMERLKTGVTLGLAYEQPDTTDLYRVTGMEGNEIILALPPGNSFISETPAAAIPGSSPPAYYDPSKRAPLVYRNYLDTSILGTSSLDSIDSNAPVVSGKSGPYPAKDPSLSSQILAAEFELSNSRNWTGFETSLGVDGEILERAQEIQIPFRLYGFSIPPDPTNKLYVIFQAGSLKDENSVAPENPNLIMEKTILDSSDPSFIFHEGARIESITLSDDDRKKLKDAKYLRLLIYYANTDPSKTLSGRVLLAPPIVRGAGFRPVTAGGGGINLAPDTGGAGSVSVIETLDAGLGARYGDLVNKLHDNGGKGQRVLEISWEALPSGEGAGADGRVGAVPLYNYRVLSFFVRRPLAANQADLDNGILRFILGLGPASLDNPGETALEAAVPLAAFDAAGVLPGRWAKVEIRYRGKNQGVYIDGTSAPGASMEFRPGVYGALNAGSQGAGSSSYTAFLLLPGSTPLPAGNMAIDEVILEEATPSYRINAGGTVEWTRPGTIVELGNTPLVSDFFVSAALETGAQGDPFNSEGGEEGLFGMSGRTRGEITVLGARINGNYSYTFSSGGYSGESALTWSAGHGISRSWGPFSVQESFADSPGDQTMNHKFSLGLAAPFRSGLSGEMLYEGNKLSRKWEASAGGNPAGAIPLDISLAGSAGWTENTAGPGEDLASYGGAWVKSWESLVPDSGYGAVRRDSRLLFKADLGTEPVGAELSLEGSTNFSRFNKTTQASTLARLDIPWKAEINSRTYRFLFRGEREYSRSLFYEAGDIREDGEKYAQSLRDSSPLMFSIPFYSLFDPAMGKALADSNSAFLSGSSLLSYGEFGDKFEFSLGMPENYGLSSLVIPSRISARINRVLEQKLDTPADTLNLGGGLDFSSINMFGAFGAAPLFSLYQSDEFSHSLDAAVAMPKNEKISWRLQAAQAASFHGFAGAELTLANTFVINSASYVGTGKRWSESVSLEWLYPMKKSLLGALYSKFMGMAGSQSSWLALAGIAREEYEQFRKETLEFVFEHSPATRAAYSDYNRYSLILGHESLIRVFGRLNLSVFAKLNISEDSNTRILSFLGLIGTTLNVSF